MVRTCRLCMRGEGSTGRMALERLGAFVDEIHRVRGVAREELREKFLAAAKTVVQKHFGDRSKIETTWNEEGGVIELRQVLTVVTIVREPFRELPLSLAQKVVGD